MLSAVAGWVGRQVELGGLFARALEAAAREIEADRATLFLLDHARGELVAVASRHPELAELRVPIERGIAGFVARTGQPVRTADARDDARFDASIDARSGYRTRCLACVPVRADDGSIIGVLEALNKREPFGADDETSLRLSAAQIAQLLASTSLHPQLSTRSHAELHWRYNGIVGRSPPMLELYERIERVAATDATVLVLGETGTGKGLVARAIHDNGARRERPLVAVDCAGLPPALVENELFGHERGAFTGADRQLAGAIERADGGTLFLDEIGELGLEAQARLLRVVQERVVQRLGGGKTQRVDVRIVAATNRDLEDMLVRGRFREDLYYRLRVVRLELPPLRDRGGEDIAALAEHFMAMHAGRHGRGAMSLAPATLRELQAHPWPGNVRELEHCLESAVVLASGTSIEPHHLALPRGPKRGTTDDRLVKMRWREVEKLYIEAVLAAHRGNRSAAARAMGIARATLLRKIATYRIRMPRSESG